jgi:hypothetical protein
VALLEPRGRSHLIGDLLTELRKREQNSLAAEGYRFYAKEAEDFAEVSRSAVTEAVFDDRPTR